MTTRPHLWLRQGLCLITLPSSARSTIWRALILLGLAGLYAPVFSDIARTWWTQRYVFILSNQVVEHLYDPVAICSTLAKLLRLGGILYVDVPNADQFRERIHRGKFLSPTDHLNHFTKKTLARLITTAGLNIVYLSGAPCCVEVYPRLGLGLFSHALARLTQRILPAIGSGTCTIGQKP